MGISDIKERFRFDHSVNVRIFIAGSALSFGLNILLTQCSLLILQYVEINTTTIEQFNVLIFTIYVSFYVISGWFGGYLAARKSSEDRIRVGFLIGVGAFIFKYLFKTLIFRPFPTRFWSFIGFVIGGSLGGFSTRISRGINQLDRD